MADDIFSYSKQFLSHDKSTGGLKNSLTKRKMSRNELHKIQRFLELVESKTARYRPVDEWAGDESEYIHWSLNIGVEHAFGNASSFGHPELLRPCEKSTWNASLLEAQQALNELLSTPVDSTTKIYLQDKDLRNAGETLEDIASSTGASEIWLSCADKVAQVSGSTDACDRAARRLIEELPPLSTANFSVSRPESSELVPIELKDSLLVKANPSPAVSQDSVGESKVYPDVELGNITKAFPLFGQDPVWTNSSHDSLVNPFDECKHLSGLIDSFVPLVPTPTAIAPPPPPPPSPPLPPPPPLSCRISPVNSGENVDYHSPSPESPDTPSSSQDDSESEHGLSTAPTSPALRPLSLFPPGLTPSESTPPAAHPVPKQKKRVRTNTWWS